MSTLKEKVISGELNPIIFMPMETGADCHVNYGYGGNFVQNGLIETADRGANQDNCVASLFDGVDDVLHSTTSMGSVSNTATVSFIVKNNGDNYDRILKLGNTLFTVGAGTLSANLRNASNANLTDVSGLTITFGAELSFQMSVDLSDTNKRHCFVNGVSIGTWVTYTNDPIDIDSTEKCIGAGSSNGGNALNGSIGELYFDMEYIDLATNNPFWNSDTNKPIPVRTAMANLGSNPLICMPIDASSPTTNYGSGGDFTLNGGGLVGARGASEYIARSANNDSNYLNSLTLSGALGADSKSISMVISVSRAVTSAQNEECAIVIEANGSRKTMTLEMASDEMMDFKLYDNTGALVINVLNIKNNKNATFATIGEWDIIFISIDSSIGVGNVYSGGQVYSSPPTSDSDFDLSSSTMITKLFYDANRWFGLLSNVYLVDSYIDFSQESNRNLFVNQLGYPRDLTPEIEAGNIPTPLIYLPFDDTDNLGKNLGTGGDFTVNGTVTAGSDFTL